MWRCSPTSVAIINISDLETHTIIDNFWDVKETPLNLLDPLVLMMNIKPEKIMSLAIVAGQQYILRTYDLEKQKFRTFLFSDYKQDLEFGEADFKVTSMDKS